jgi:glutathione synthase/RimK-type ligase-like ATP-grasp enzyme
MKIAIGHDLIGTHTDGKPQSFSATWKALADDMGVSADVIDPLVPGALDGIGAYDGFIWRYTFKLPWTDAAPRLMRSVEDEHHIPVWPSRVLRDTFENKIAQAYLLDAIDIPHPRSWIFWRRQDALDALDALPYPLVAKLSRGVKSEGVALIRDRDDAARLVRQMFTLGAGSLDFLRSRRSRMLGRYTPLLGALRAGRIEGNHEQGYVLLQEFLPGNGFDTRLVVQGDCAAGSRRLNRDGDFRASGSGRSDFDAAAINPRAVALAFRLADTLQVRSLVVDVMERDGEPVMGEFSYSMAAHVVQRFQGHWRRGPEGIVHHDAPMDWPRLILEDFLVEVRSRRSPDFPARMPRAVNGRA